MFEVQWARDLEDSRDFGFLSEGQAGYESWADGVGVDEVGANVVDELAAGAQGGGNAPRFLRGEIEVGADDGGAGLAIFGGEAFGVGGERDDYFDAERTEDSHLFVGPICADGGLYNVQDLHGGDYSNPERPLWRIQIRAGEFVILWMTDGKSAGKMPALQRHWRGDRAAAIVSTELQRLKPHG